MQPNKVSPLSMFSQPLQYLVPIFQRGYVWTIERQVQPLWADIADRANEVAKYQSLYEQARKEGSTDMVKPPRKHFLGTVIITDYRAGAPGEPHTTEVIDGQQRMTTTQLLALAFRDAISGVEDLYLKQCVDIYTRNGATYKQPHHHFKVWPTNAGRTEMTVLSSASSAESVCDQYPIMTIGGGKSKKRVPRPLLVEAYLYFYGVISMYLRGKSFDEIAETREVIDAVSRKISVDEEAPTELTLADQWVHQIRHESKPKVPFCDEPIDVDRVPLLLTTLTEYLQLIELRLGADDDAQVIFETLNDRGERLTAADLVRNFVFLEATRKGSAPDKLYEAHWRDFDETAAEKGAVSKTKLFWKVEERQGRLSHTRLDTLLYHYVSMRTMDDLKLDHVFESFKQWWSVGNKDVKTELARLRSSAELFRSLMLPDRTTRLGRFAHNMRVLDSSTMTPAVLFLGERLGESSVEFLDCLQVLESYVVRRAICGLTPKAYNRVFLGLLKKLFSLQQPNVQAIADHFDGLSGGATQNWPTDEQFGKAWLESGTYKVLRSAKTRMVLEALELGSRNMFHHETYALPTGNLHVEHVLPIAWHEHWPLKSLDPAAPIARDVLLHSIGNLTLLTEKLNPSIGNQPFHVKRPQMTKSLLALNAYFQDARWSTDEWDESTIQERASALLEVAKKIWPHSPPKA